MLPVLWIIFGILVQQSTSQQDKWVWGENGRSDRLSAGLDAKGKYGIFEPPIPEEPYSPPVRPPPKDLPPLVRPFNKFNERPSYQVNEGGRFESNRPYQPNVRPYEPPSQRFEPRPYEPNRPYESNRPYRPDRPYAPDRPQSLVPRPPPHRGEIETADPTKFDKCKCTHSFNCKSPGIVFGHCDVGKKYCCEKHNLPPVRGPLHPVNDGSEPEVLAGPGGPVDHFLNKRPTCTGLSCYSNIQQRNP